MQERSECASRLLEGELDSSLRAHTLWEDFCHLWDEILPWFDRVVWESPQNSPWERRDQPKCQFPFYLCQAHAGAAGAGTQIIQAGSAPSCGAQQPQPGPAALGDLHPCGHPSAEQVTRNTPSLPEKRWNCYPMDLGLLSRAALGTATSCYSLCKLI